MKDMISRNWKKILVAIGWLFTFMILITKFIAPKTIIEDYIKYGKVIEPIKTPIINSEAIKPVGATVTPEVMKIIVALVTGIIIVLILTMLASSGGKDAKKK